MGVGINAATDRVRQSHAVLPIATNGRSSRAVLEGLRILVVDDDECQATALAALLRDDGISATSLVDAEQALTRFVSEPLDALVVDVKMPRLDGPGLLAGLRVAHPRLPAVLLTGYERHADGVARAMALGGVAYLAKPVDLDAVRLTLARLIERGRAS